jgi:ubiquinone biosynthesis protein Coq4
LSERGDAVDTEVTLRVALEDLRERNLKYFTSRDVSPEAREFFRCHDVAHVVFGCNTTIVGEGTVKIWTIFGTTLGFWNHIRGYAEADAFSLFRQYSWAHVAKSIARLVVTTPRAILRARQMTKPWPWASHDGYLDRQLTEVRSEFNIIPL